MSPTWPDLVVAPQPLAVEVGATVLAEGGNAVDAAVAAALAQGVTDPQMCGIGGFGALQHYDAATGQTTSLQFPGTAGSLIRDDMWLPLLREEYRVGYGFRLSGYENDVGWQSVATPGTVAGLAEAHRRWGSQPWDRLVEPAARLAEEGFTLTPPLTDRWRRPGTPGFAFPLWRLTHTPAAARLFTRDGATPLQMGERLIQRDYAHSLRRLADEGPQDFYSGGLGRQLGQAIMGHGGYVTPDDLAAYRVRNPAPAIGHYRGLTVQSDPLPDGGATLIQMLHALEPFDLVSLGHNSPRYVDLVARTMQWAFADWTTRLGDPHFTTDLTPTITDPAYAAEAAARLATGEKFPVPRWQPPEHKDTTHITIVDRTGNCVSLTHSLGASSGAVVDGLGFQLNNCMNCFHPVPGLPNSLAVGKARLSGISPTIVTRDGQPVIVIGAPGGTQIITGVLQVLLNLIDFDMTPTEAVAAPRFDSQSHVIDLQARHPLATVRALQHMGHTVYREGFSYGSFGLVHVAVRDPQRGGWHGAADPGGAGMPLSSVQLG